MRVAELNASGVASPVTPAERGVRSWLTRAGDAPGTRAVNISLPVGTGGRIQVLVADDHESVRARLRALFATTSDIELVGEARDGMEAIRLARSLRPDVAILDHSMPGLSGLSVAQALALECRSTYSIVFSSDEHIGAVAALSGAFAFLVKSARAEEILAAVRAHQRSGARASRASR